MTKATLAGRTLTEDLPAVSGGNPNDPESGRMLAGCLDPRTPSAQASRGFSFWSPPMRNRFHLAAVVVLLIGLGAAGAIYFNAEEEPQLSTSYVVVMDPATTKTYVREPDCFGGKAAVLFDDFSSWFAGRSH